jgi:hypothetical protein
MIGVPYLTVTALGFSFYRMAKKHRQTLDMASTSCDSAPLNPGVERS